MPSTVAFVLRCGLCFWWTGVCVSYYQLQSGMQFHVSHRNKCVFLPDSIAACLSTASGLWLGKGSQKNHPLAGLDSLINLLVTEEQWQYQYFHTPAHLLRLPCECWIVQAGVWSQKSLTQKSSWWGGHRNLWLCSSLMLKPAVSIHNLNSDHEVLSES